MLRVGLLLGLGPGAAIGLGRFGYGLLLPGMKEALDLTLSQAGALGSANTAGYLLGAMVSHRVLDRVGYRRGFYAAAIIQALTLVAMGLDIGFAGMFVARAVQGVLGAVVLVGGATLVLSSGGRAGAVGAYYGGVGGGIAISALVIPSLATFEAGWFVLGALAGVLALASTAAARSLSEPARRRPGEGASLAPVVFALAAYGLYGGGYIGYMTFAPSEAQGSMTTFWLILGLATAAHGFVWGPVVRRRGAAVAIRLSLAVLVVASLAPLLRLSPSLSALLFGLSFLGCVTAITELFRVVLPPHAWARAMAVATVAFGVGQAAGPWLVGVVGDLFMGVAGALWASTLLLVLAFAVSLARPGIAAKK